MHRLLVIHLDLENRVMQRVITARARGLLFRQELVGSQVALTKSLGLSQNAVAFCTRYALANIYIWKLKLLGQTLGLLCSRSRCFMATALATACERNVSDLQ